MRFENVCFYLLNIAGILFYLYSFLHLFNNNFDANSHDATFFSISFKKKKYYVGECFMFIMQLYFSVLF